MDLDTENLDKLKAIAELVAREAEVQLSSTFSTTAEFSFLGPTESQISAEKISPPQDSFLLVVNSQKEELGSIALTIAQDTLVLLKDSQQPEGSLEEFLQLSFTTILTLVLEKFNLLKPGLELGFNDPTVKKLELADDASLEFKELLKEPVAIEFKLKTTTVEELKIHVELDSALVSFLIEELSEVLLESNKNRIINADEKDKDLQVNQKRNFNFLKDINLDLIVELGRVQMSLCDVLKLAKGSAIELDRQSNQSVDLYVHNQLIAKGEIVAVDDCFGLRVTEILGKLDNVVLK